MEPKWMPRYLNALDKTGLPRTAAAAARVTMRMVNKQRAEDHEFDEACEHAEELFNDRVEAEAIRRAVSGYEEPIYHQGVQVGSRLVYSDTLMTQLLKGRRSKVYGDRKDVRLSADVQVILAPIAQPNPLLPHAPTHAPTPAPLLSAPIRAIIEHESALEALL